MEKRKYDLEDRPVAFASACLDIFDLLPDTKAAQNLSYQLSKSSTAAALNYGETQAAESPADFVHKLKIVLKEIRESRVNLRIISVRPLLKGEKPNAALNECNQLMAIFITSIDTAKRNNSDWDSGKKQIL